MMNAGEMNEQIQVYRQVRTPDGVGGFLTSWELQATLFAMVERISGTKLVSYGMTLQKRAYEITVRSQRGYNADGDFNPNDYSGSDFFVALGNNSITDQSWLLKFRGRELNVTAVLEKNGKTWVTILATERV
ncbi:MAG: hypothetical protein GC193_13180 [Cryomorphaceae bacterium]|nr:hypothetical protein [Cryomorphaceae bacterium]